MKYLDNIPEDVIAGLNIPTGVPLVYELDADLKPIPHPDAIAPLTVRGKLATWVPAVWRNSSSSAMLLTWRCF